MENDDGMEVEFDPMKIVGPWCKRFVESEYFKGLDEPLKDQALDIIETFANCAFEQIGDKPNQWITTTVDECCLEFLPRKVAEESAYFQAVGPVLAAFFRFLDAEKLLAKAGQLARHTEKISPQIVKEAADPSNWGMAKTMVMGAIAAGVDMGNQEAMNRYLMQYNQRMAQRLGDQTASGPWMPAPAYHSPVPVQRTTPKLGRNDPCHCGSGKKYKNCHLALDQRPK